MMQWYTVTGATRWQRWVNARALLSIARLYEGWTYTVEQGTYWLHIGTMVCCTIFNQTLTLATTILSTRSNSAPRLKRHPFPQPTNWGYCGFMAGVVGWRCFCQLPIAGVSSLSPAMASAAADEAHFHSRTFSFAGKFLEFFLYEPCWTNLNRYVVTERAEISRAQAAVLAAQLSHVGQRVTERAEISRAQAAEQRSKVRALDWLTWFQQAKALLTAVN